MLNTLPDAFNDVATVTHSHIEAANVPAQIKPLQNEAIEAPPRAKRGQPLDLRI